MQRPARILVVDDEPTVLITYRTILEFNGYEVAGALTSAEAYDALDRDTFDVVLCDLSLEKNRSGFDVLDYARKRHPRTHALLLTGFATEEISEQAETRGFTVLFKPVQIENLLTILGNLTCREKAG